ncbi:MAG: helix-turn-helix transcriptional regulator [Candidatus Nanopelagicaceae bacterium]|nr:helix-turn-helix transcriptional regulator [Candidatus Nanopelagicaceae bacterium]
MAIVRSTSDWESEVGDRVRLVRKQRKMTQQELADRSNVSRSAIKYLEAGKGSSLATFLNVVRALDLDENLNQIFAVVSTISPLALLHDKKKSGQ